MNNKFRTVMLVAVLTCGISLAQMSQAAEVDDWKPASSNQPGREYPQVNSEGRVRARIVAPGAQSVLLDIGGVKYPLTKGEDGVWMGDSAPQDEGFHYYQLVIDGAFVPDPGSTYYYGAGRWGSGVECLARDQDIYALKNVPHGQIREVHYYSKSTESIRRCFVYTPPDYDKDTSQRYPVLYLQHGGGEDETNWPNQGKANLIMDNLIAEGKAKPFIIVMDNGTWTMPSGDRPRPPRGERRPGAWPPAGWADGFKKTLLEDIIPMIDSNFRTHANADNRAMAGFSMGGMQTNAIAMENLDVFSYVGILSGGTVGDPATAHNGVMSNTEEFNKKCKLIFQSCGSKERPVPLRANHEQLTDVGINSAFYISPDTGHEWLTNRRGLYQFTQLLFQADLPTLIAKTNEESVKIFESTVQIDNETAAEASTTEDSEPTAITTMPIRINAGRFTSFTDSSGQVWLSEQGFEGGATIDRDPSMVIEGTKDPTLFLSEHYAMESFSCKVPNGKYIAKLYFAETYEGIFGPGDRVFSFKVQGHEFKDFDIWEKAGGTNRAYVETVPVEVTNGEFRIDFTFQVENPAINAIEIIPQTAAQTSVADQPAPVRDVSASPDARRGRGGME